MVETCPPSTLALRGNGFRSYVELDEEQCKSNIEMELWFDEPQDADRARRHHQPERVRHGDSQPALDKGSEDVTVSYLEVSWLVSRALATPEKG